MELKEITLDDKNKIDYFVMREGENSCEIAYINLLLWHKLYGVTFFADDRSLILKSDYMGFDCYNVPFGDIYHGF